MSAKARPPEAMAHAVASLCVVLAACASAPSVRSGPPAPAGEAPVLALTVKPGDRDKVPLPTSLPVLKLPEQQHFVLANGLKVRLVEVHKLPILSLYLVVDAGAIHDPSGAPGLASMTAA
ncbi:MAG TPA: insulinase family protein, partial [Anaeromyxobacteraceae bacterium]|nr:insulinase family protein [Anaeromyxobacteraceae bacterium]